ncbi:GNAT family N-acetyltransferase [Polyangium aurulentum]|uniref:GNAT family N-acetyltransferase n=1 Tax=Polyangium aurulentum TaxID=2567896 RepID=UPI0010AEA11A|nr:GNAT family N-acetyltransferase [Polyangium aurulentum]UQA59823.1 GNAT family N-acetyltransferase [Polyangium aurulentum]
MNTHDIRRISAAETRHLRRVVLRPHQRPEDLVYPGDDALDTLHLELSVGGEQRAVASMYREPPPGTQDAGAYRLRGMAVLPEDQGRGYGAALVQACVEHARQHGGTRLWCNARTTAAGFYRKLGFEAVGDEFELPGIGPHYLMSRTV